MKVKISDGISKHIAELARKVRDLSPAMRRIRREVLEPLIPAAWAKSGLHSRTGELRKAMGAWGRKRSAGLALRTKKGLVLPKAIAHMFGAKAGQWKKKREYEVRGISGKSFKRKNAGSPWGAIPARPFFPRISAIRAHERRIAEIITKFLEGGA